MAESTITSNHAGAAALLELKARYLIPCVYHFYKQPPQIVAGEGSCLFDSEGKRYLDCYSGVTVISAGHCNAQIIEPAIEQMRTLQHTTSIYLTEPVLRLAEKLASIAPGNLCRSFFCASGSEAVEGTLLLAMLHTKRPKVIAMTCGLHGRTRFGMNLTGLPMWRTDPFPMADIIHVPFGDIAALRQCLDEHGAETAAVIGEPIQGNGGIIVPPPEYWPAVRGLCDEHGCLMILDEIQTGMNRTGRWFACEHWGVTPDVMAISKALGNGFPIAAFMTTDAIAASYTRPGASTYGGNPVSAAAALATIQYHESNRLGERARALGPVLRAALDECSQRALSFGPPRGLGLMLGLPVINAAGRPDADRCDRLLESLKDHGVLAGKTGVDRNILSFMPPLTMSDGEMEEVIDVLRLVLA